MKCSSWIISRLSLIATLIAAAAPLARADVIMDWNAKADAIAAEKQIPPAPHSRALSMMHVAMFEAVNAIDRRYAPYKISLSADRSTSREAAAAVAAHDVLLSIYPDLKPDLDATLTNALAPIAEGESKIAGIALGKEAAAQIMELRAKDGSNAVETYRPLTTPGAYVPTVVPLFSTTGATTPWVMASGSQFRPGPPPALDSEVWTRDVNEIREVGSRASSTRTPEQTTIGRFWFFVGARTYNPIVKQAATAKGMDLVDCARLYALTSIAGNDALVAVFDAKYHYNFWRPITAIRLGSTDGNPDTTEDAAWTPLLTTPNHPDYPSGHATVSPAAALEWRGYATVSAIAVLRSTPPASTR